MVVSGFLAMLGRQKIKVICGWLLSAFVRKVGRPGSDNCPDASNGPDGTRNPAGTPFKGDLAYRSNRFVNRNIAVEANLLEW
jgi:hypothetical protein